MRIAAPGLGDCARPYPPPSPPPELSEELAAAPDARERFDGLAYTHRREYAQWISEAKRAETRRDRAERAIAMLREGVRHP